MEVNDDPPPLNLLVHVAFPSLGSEGLSVCQLSCERPIEHSPCGVTRDGDREVVRSQASLGEGLLQKVDIEVIPDALPAFEPAEWRYDGNILALQPDLGGEFEVRRPDRFKIPFEDLLEILLFLFDVG